MLKRALSSSLSVFSLSSACARALELGAVERGLFALHFAEQVLLDPRGEILRDLLLGAAQDERADAAGEAPAGERVLLLVVRSAEARARGRARRAWRNS